MLKNYLIVFILLIVFNISNAQDVQFPPAIISLGGGSVDANSTHISKWRIGKIHVLQINSKDFEEVLNVDWKMQVYPNPVDEFLNIKFLIESPITFEINVYDLAGKNIFIRENNKINPNEIFQINFAGFSSAIYFVNIKSRDLDLNNTIKIVKH